MPRARKPCSRVGCKRLTHTDYCDQHRAEHRQRADSRRGTAAQRGYDARWRAARRAYLSHHPLCAECESKGRIRSATVVDHIIPHRGDEDTFWDEGNWQSLCAAHHNAKTARGE